MDKDILNRIDPRELGRELQLARNRRGLTQAESANIISAARTTITAIEKGSRRVKPDELIKLAKAYGRRVNEFVHIRPQIEPFQPQFRGPYQVNREEKKKINECISVLEDLARNYLELERITDNPLLQKYPEEYKINGLPVDKAAEMIASQERNRLGLGDGPLPILRDILEQEVGLRIFYLPLYPSKFSAIYLYDHGLGGSIAVNSNHPEDRRRWSLAHDYGHFLTSRYKQRLFFKEEFQRVPAKEQFADDFALFFLMTTSSLMRRFNEIRAKGGKISAASLCILANYYGVSLDALTNRLEDMRLLPAGIWEKLKDRGFKVRKAQSQLGLRPIPAKEDKLPMRYQYLALDAFNDGLISEGQLTKFLGVDRLEARRTVQELDELGILGGDSTLDIEQSSSGVGDN